MEKFKIKKNFLIKKNNKKIKQSKNYNKKSSIQETVFFRCCFIRHCDKVLQWLLQPPETPYILQTSTPSY